MKEVKYATLSQRFSAQGLPYRYEANYVDLCLKDKYRAIALDPALFQELQADPFYREDCQTHVYAVVREADSHFIEHDRSEARLDAIDSGRVAYVMFQSKNGLLDCDFMSLHGDFSELEQDMMVWNGISQADAQPDNPAFQYYLDLLVANGKLTV